MFEAMATAEAPAQAVNADLVGRWEGAIRVGETVIPIVIRVAEGSDGLRAVMDSPSQGARDIPVADLTETSGVVRFTVPAVAGRFEGARSEDGSTWTGTLFQGAASLPLILTRAAATVEVAAPPARPQTPVPPLPYAAEDVTFRNDGAGITLAGTLTVPQGAGPFPAVILLTGSGAQDRDETILGHKPFAVWADALTRRGVAVLRYDDRGMGGSGGGSMDETTADFATDARAAMDYLRTRPEIDANRIGLMGHSEGAMAATRTPDMGFKGIIISGFVCSLGVKAGAATPLLAISWSSDPYFQRAGFQCDSQWGARDNGIQLVLPGHGHSTSSESSARQAVANFLDNNTEK